MILDKDMIIRIVRAFDEILKEENEGKDREDRIKGIRQHEYYELSVPRGEGPTSKYLVEYDKIEHFLNTEYPDMNLSNMSIEEIKDVLRDMLDVYIEAYK